MVRALRLLLSAVPRAAPAALPAALMLAVGVSRPEVTGIGPVNMAPGAAPLGAVVLGLLALLVTITSLTVTITLLDPRRRDARSSLLRAPSPSMRPVSLPTLDLPTPATRPAGSFPPRASGRRGVPPELAATGHRAEQPTRNGRHGRPAQPKRPAQPERPARPEPAWPRRLTRARPVRARSARPRRATRYAIPARPGRPHAQRSAARSSPSRYRRMALAAEPGLTSPRRASSVRTATVIHGPSTRKCRRRAARVSERPKPSVPSDE